MSGSFYSSYLASGMSASGFLPFAFGSPADRLRRVLSASRRTAPAELVEVLRAQGEALPKSAQRAANLDALGRPGTVAVVTGQQVGLFLGPLYTIYKAATACVLARALEEETGVRCVPIFWLQTEDHDFVEIAECQVPREDGASLRLAIGGAAGGADARSSVAARRLGDDVVAELELLAEQLATEPHAAELLTLLGAHYRPGVSPGHAFAGVIAALFAGEGLIVFDPREETVARLAAPVIRASLVEHERIDALLAERGRLFAAHGFDEQVRPRPGSPLAFFHERDARGPRYRLERRGELFALAGKSGSFTLAELLDTLARDPLRFSTSALLRPLVQDTLLPTAAYVGGPAELAYSAQVAPLYPLFGIEQPLIAPRARFRLIPSQARTLLTKLGLAPADVERPRAVLLSALAARVPALLDGPPPPSESWLAELDRHLDDFAARAAALDPRLARDAARTRESARRALARLGRRHEAQVIARDRTLADRVTRLQRWLFPDGAPQERRYSLPYFAARYGLGPLVAAVVAALDPFHPEVRDLDP